VTDDLPTARNTLPKDAWLCLFVWCEACKHQGPRVPLKDLKVRCAACGSRMTDHVTMAKHGGLPSWRFEAG
jgi:hypothetical protein